MTGRERGDDDHADHDPDMPPAGGVLVQWHVRWWFVAVVLLAGCDKLFGLAEIAADGGASDGGDAQVVVDTPPNGTVCAGGTNGGPLHICEQATNLAPRVYTESVDVDTDAPTTCDRVEAPADGQPSLCVVMATDMTIMSGATIRATGSRPLVLVAMGTLTVSGSVDVSSHAAGTTGAAANDVSCDPNTGGLPQAAAANTSGGGAGGSFGGTGGTGGAPGGASDGAHAGPTVDGSQLMQVRGGCPGGIGGVDHDGGFGASGASGGAVYLMATTMIVLKDGVILANGAAGGGGRTSIAGDFPGGGGGGSGGLVMLDSPNILLQNAVVMASGGGGGGGEGANSTFGSDGGEPTASAPLVPAPGGPAGTMAGSGGFGSSLNGPGPGGGGVDTEVSGGAAGGGGGGAGVIRIFGPFSGTSQIVPLQS
jgi:hypothetical protein